MFHIRKIVIALFACSSNLALAGTMGPVCESVHVGTPCAGQSWKIGGQALYLQANSSGALSNSSINRTNGDYVNYPQPWQWGFQLEAEYQYTQANDVNINWYHLNNSAHNSISGPFIVDQLYSNPASSSAYLTSNPKWDNVNIEFGQKLIVNDNKSLRLHAGVDFSRVDNATTRTVNNVSTSSIYYDSQSVTFNGFGPRAGADFSYDLTHGIGVYAKTAAGLLAGQSKTSFTDSDNVNGVITRAPLSASTQKVVPQLEGKLGVTYNYALAKGDLTLDAGWLWIDYVNAQSGLIAFQQNTIDQDFSLQGLYFGMKWHGNMA